MCMYIYIYIYGYIRITLIAYTLILAKAFGDTTVPILLQGFAAGYPRTVRSYYTPEITIKCILSEIAILSEICILSYTSYSIRNRYCTPESEIPCESATEHPLDNASEIPLPLKSEVPLEHATGNPLDNESGIPLISPPLIRNPP